MWQPVDGSQALANAGRTGEQWLTGAGNAVGEQGLGSTPALTVLHWHKQLALHPLLLGGKEPMAGRGQCYHRAQLGEKKVLPALESWAVGAPAVGIQFPAGAVSLWS